MKYLNHVGYICGAFLLLLIGTFAFDKSDFSPRRIQVPLLSSEDPASYSSFKWPKKFHFLGRGHQMYAFESEDKQFVLKFFDRHQLKLHWYAYLPLKISNKKMRRLKERIAIYPQSYRLAFEWFRNETALLAIHQGISSQKYPTVQVIDSDSRSFKIDLNHVPFVLQKKVESSLPELLDKANQEGTLSALIDQFLGIHRQRISLQIADHDRDIYDNYGWDGTRLIYLDPARFYLEKNLSNPRFLRAEWFKVTGPVRKWLLKNAPQELPFFDAKIKQFLDSQRPELYRDGVCGNDTIFLGTSIECFQLNAIT